MQKFHSHVHMLNLKDFILRCLSQNEVSPSGSRNIGQMIISGRWITVVGLSPGPGSFLRFSLEFSHVSLSYGTFPNHAVPLLWLQASYGCRNIRAYQDRDRCHVDQAVLPPAVSRVAPKCGASPLDKPHTCFMGLGTWKQALRFSHQAPMLISKSFTNWIYVFLALPRLLYLHVLSLLLYFLL